MSFLVLGFKTVGHSQVEKLVSDIQLNGPEFADFADVGV